MPQLIDCPACARAIRRDETACPFCGAEQRRVEVPSLRQILGVVLGLMTVSCSDKPSPDTESTATPTSTVATTDGQSTQGTTPTGTTATGTDSTTAQPPTSTTTTSTSSTTDGSASVSDSMDSFNVTTAYAAALETESAGAPPAVTEGDTDSTTTGEPR